MHLHVCALRGVGTRWSSSLPARLPLPPSTEHTQDDTSDGNNDRDPDGPQFSGSLLQPRCSRSACPLRPSAERPEQRQGCAWGCRAVGPGSRSFRGVERHFWVS